MKKKRLLSLAIFFLGVGYAGVSTTLNMVGDVNIATNYADFDVRITKATLEDNAATISEEGNVVTFNTSSLSTVGNKTTLDFTAFNNSEQYDADVSLVCTAGEEKQEYFEMTSTPITIAGKRTGQGQVAIELINAKPTATEDAFICTLKATPKERITKAEKKLYKVLQDEAESGGVAKEYTGTHQDSFNGVVDKKIFHYYASDSASAVTVMNKNNVIFAGQCWQMIRTTDTGGVKMIYNGESVDNKCLSTRGTHVGYSSRTSQDLASNYWYGTDYIYDNISKTFKISGTTEQARWNATTGPGLIGKYTCKLTSADGSCETLYLVESYENSSSAYVIPLNSNSHYSQFGTLQFNANYNSPAYVGYMYNTVYSYKSMANSSSGKLDDTTDNRWYFGNNVTYENGIYTLVNYKQFDLSSDYDKLSNNHYTCNGEGVGEQTPTTTCASVKYIYYTNSSKSNYIELTNGKKVEDVFNEMLYDDNVNTTNSIIKSGVDAWYKHYLLDYNDYIEDTIFCNNRSINSLAGWNPNGGSTSVGSNNNYLRFKGFLNNKDLSCNKPTDQFSISNNRAKLTYKVGLMSIEEMILLSNSNIRKTGQDYWVFSPTSFNGFNAYERIVESNGNPNGFDINSVGHAYGVRPAISLKPGTEYSDGDGSMENPYKVN